MQSSPSFGNQIKNDQMRDTYENEYMQSLSLTRMEKSRFQNSTSNLTSSQTIITSQQLVLITNFIANRGLHGQLHKYSVKRQRLLHENKKIKINAGTNWNTRQGTRSAVFSRGPFSRSDILRN